MAYVKAVASSASNENTGLLGPGFTTLDGVTLVANVSRILLTRQTTTSQNGVWIYNGAATALSRPAVTEQYAMNTSLDNATVVWVTGGTLRAGTVWGIDPAKHVTVDNAVTGLHTLTRVALPPAQCRVASEGINYALGSTFTSIDGVSGASTPPLQGNGAAGSDIVLLKDQADPKENGLYWVNTTGPLTGKRTTEPLVPSRAVAVSEGARNAHTQWAVKTQGTINLGVSALPFVRQDVTDYSFDSIAALKQFTAALPNATATVAGYYVPGDGGGGDFTFLGVPAGGSAKITAASPQSIAIASVANADPPLGQAKITTAAGHGLWAGAGTNVASVYLTGLTEPRTGRSAAYRSSDRCS